MTTLLAQIMAKEAAKPTPVEVAEWGLTVFVKPITAGELAAAFQAGKEGDFTLVHQCVVDASGQRVFPDVEAVKARSPKAVGQLVRAVMDHNRIGQDEHQDADEKKG